MSPAFKEKHFQSLISVSKHIYDCHEYGYTTPISPSLWPEFGSYESHFLTVCHLNSHLRQVTSLKESSKSINLNSKFTCVKKKKNI